jgi:putative transposase
MPRPPRRELAGGIHHVTARGNNGEAVFRDMADRRNFLRLLRSALTDFDWLCLTYCLMTNHYHLLLLTQEPTLGAGIGWLNGTYAQRFNRRHSRTGHLWEQRYHSLLVERGAHLLEVIRYIALNPVRAGLCTRPEEWEWGAHRALAGLEPAGFRRCGHDPLVSRRRRRRGRRSIPVSRANLKGGWHRLRAPGA